MSQAPNVYTDKDVPEEVRKKFPALLQRKSSASSSSTKPAVVAAPAPSAVAAPASVLAQSNVLAPSVFASRFIGATPELAKASIANSPLAEYYYDEKSVPEEVRSKFPALLQRRAQTEQAQVEVIQASAAQQQQQQEQAIEEGLVPAGNANEEGAQEVVVNGGDDGQGQVAPLTTPSYLAFPEVPGAPRYTQENVPEDVLSKFPALRQRFGQKSSAPVPVAAPAPVQVQAPAVDESAQKASVFAPFASRFATSKVGATNSPVYFGPRPEGAKVYSQDDVPEDIKRKFPTLQGEFRSQLASFPNAPLTISQVVQPAQAQQEGDANAGSQ